LVSQYQKGKTSPELNEARDDGVSGCSGISWTICKQSAPHSRQITTPTPHRSISTGQMLFLTPNQQRRSTEGSKRVTAFLYDISSTLWTVSGQLSSLCVTGMWQAEMQRQLQKEREEQLRLMQHQLQVDTHAHMHP